MKQIQVDKQLDELPKPCEVFNLMVGTSTGGLITLMLARLELSVDECITEYERISKDVFGEKNEERYEAFGVAKDLEDAVKRVVTAADKDKNPDAMMQSGSKCRAVVIASRTDDISTQPPTHFRTYWMQSGNSLDCKIWEAARATSAAPAYFERIKVGGFEYVDGGLQANNPVIQTLSESMVAFGEPRPVGCLISLGTGMPPPQALRDHSGFFGNIKSFTSLGAAIVGQLTNSHRAHLDVTGLNLHQALAAKYYRFNALLGIDLSSGDPKWESKAVGLDNTRLIPKFKAASEDYLKGAEPQEWLKDRARIPGRRLDQQKA
ncbi:acyl transferase/acyl hydrolase/lysophospholipase [Rhizoctonia solani]|nr:acyl transferase/acyl hydrolase/lysophospholipase [Rhizoctonia solani]